MLSWRVNKRQSNRSRRKGNTLGRVVWVLISVMLVLLFAAVLAALGVLYVVLFSLL
jgi:hypothetical protein